MAGACPPTRALALLVAAICLLTFSTTSASACQNGELRTVGGQQRCVCYGANPDQGVLSNTFYGPQCEFRCSEYCNNRGMCSISTPDVCVCHDPSRWEGDQCDVWANSGAGYLGTGESCAASSHCISKNCVSGTCQAATCSDGIRNGGESGIDCGGTCGACDSGNTCSSGQQCDSGVCTGGSCSAPSCGDGVMNGDESGVDCGGSCAACAGSSQCSADSDCVSCSCESGQCEAAPPASCGPISPCLLQRLMGQPSCPLCTSYAPALNAALERFDMTCPSRYTAFLAHVAEATGGLQQELAPTGDYSAAGAVPLTVPNLRLACSHVPEVKAEFTAALGGSCSGSDICGCGSDQGVTTLVSKPELAFAVSAWWFSGGATLAMGSACGDLRADADSGMGSPASAQPPTASDSGSGVYATLPCGVAGGFAEYYKPAVADRVIALYRSMVQLWDPLFGTCSTCSASDVFTVDTAESCGARQCSSCASCASGEVQLGGCFGPFNRECRACSECSAGLAVTQQCTATTDTVCTQCSVCPAGSYESSPCSASADRSCSTCSSCSADQWEAQECTAGSDTQCHACTPVPSQFPSLTASLDITLERMKVVGGCAAGDSACLELRLPLQTALIKYNMSTPLRASALAAQIRYATAFDVDHFFKGVQVDGEAVYSAGAIPLLVDNIRNYCRDDSYVQSLVRAIGGSACAGKADPCASCATDKQMAELIATPVLALDSAAWWFTRGARQSLGAPCFDLRGDADLGIGSYGLPSPTHRTPGVGFRKITSCILGFGTPGVDAAAREELYIAVMRVWDEGYLRCAVPGHAWPSCSDGVQNGFEAGQDCGGGCGKCPLGAACFEDDDCEGSGIACLQGRCGELSLEEKCSDGVRNYDELGVDCGGSCEAGCGEGAQCIAHDDCESGACDSGVCVACVNGEVIDGRCSCWGSDPAAGKLSPTYFGLGCAGVCRTDRCSSRGQCHESNAASCVCDEPLRFEGDTCATSTCGHGYAVYQTPTQIKCQCSPGWTGPTCSAKVECIHGEWAGAGCRCDRGWSGDDCSVAVAVNKRCVHGVWDAVNFMCICDTPWIGGKCDRVWQEVPPAGACYMGIQDGSGGCACDAMWSGAACNTTSCVYGDAMNGACSCVAGWVGSSCDTHARGACSFTGTLSNGVCECDSGSQGSTCHISRVYLDAPRQLPAFGISGSSEDTTASIRVIHAPQLCASDVVDAVCLPFEFVLLTDQSATVTFTLAEEVAQTIPMTAREQMHLRQSSSSLAAALGVSVGDVSKVGNPSGCTPQLQSLDATNGVMSVTLCPGWYYRAAFDSSDGGTGGGLGGGISGQEDVPVWSAASSLRGLSAVTAMLVAVVCVVLSSWL